MSEAAPAAAPKLAPADKKMEDIVSLCKRRGFIYPASEIYGGINGFWDFGPLGTLLKNNIRDWWWHCMVECPPIGPDGDPVQIVGVDTAIIQNPKTWVASGHAGGFSDPMCTCRQCKKLMRADHVEDMLKESDWLKNLAATGLVSGTSPAVAQSLSSMVAFSVDDHGGAGHGIWQWASDSKRGKKFAPGILMLREKTDEGRRAAGQNLLDWKAGISGTHIPLWQLLYVLANGPEGLDESKKTIPACPHCGGDLTEPKDFNLMFESHAGPVQSEDNKVWLRPETAQGIFLNYKNVLDTTRVKVPFGVAQVGKSFRNEVTPRNYIFRSREFEQMEMEWFCPPDESMKWYEFWKAERMKWWLSLGVDPANLRFKDHDKLAHYAKACADVEYVYPFTAPDFGELEGVAHRGDFDLSQHSSHSGQRLDYFDQELQEKLKAEGKTPEEVKAKSRYVPHVIEPASGLTRAVLVLLCEAYTPDPSRPSGVYLKLKPRFAPVKVGIFPLVNKDGLPEIAKELYLGLRGEFTCEYDAKQAIGKRYARMDEIGTPFCIAVDEETKTGGQVTIRDRDTMTQVRVPLTEVRAWLRERIEA